MSVLPETTCFCGYPWFNMRRHIVRLKQGFVNVCYLWQSSKTVQVEHRNPPGDSPQHVCSKLLGNIWGCMPWWEIQVNTKHLYNICTMLDQRRSRCADVVQMLYTCFVFAERSTKNGGRAILLYVHICMTPYMYIIYYVFTWRRL